jgi:hypothetical protein
VTPEQERNVQFVEGRTPNEWLKHARTSYVACGVLATHAVPLFCSPLFFFVGMALDPGAGRGPGGASWTLGYGICLLVCILSVAAVLRAIQGFVSVPRGVSALRVAFLIVSAGFAALLLWVNLGPFGSINGAALFLTVPATLLSGYWATRPAAPHGPVKAVVE